MSIKRLSNQINEEALGIAEPTLDCVDISSARVYVEILDAVEEEIEIGEKISKELVINYSDIKRIVTNWDRWSEFPVSEILIDLTLIKKNVKDIKSLKMDQGGFIHDEYNMVPFKMGAYASSFARGREKKASRFKDQIKWSVDHTLSIHFGIDLIYSDLLTHSRSGQKYEKDLQNELENVLLHEINHLFEYYKRKMSGKKEMETTLTNMTTSGNTHMRPKLSWKYWYEFFTYYIYMAEPHELNAYTQECKLLISKLGIDDFKKHKMWVEVMIMKNYDYKKFLKTFTEIISKVNPDQPDITISLFISDFKKEYKKTLQEYKEKGVISPTVLDKMSDEEFFEYWQKRIRRAGEVLYKRILRLYSYSH